MIVIHVDRTKCAGHALCASRAPDVYELDPAGFCASDGKVVKAELIQQAKLGARCCPERAITLQELDEPPEAKPGPSTESRLVRLTFIKPDGSESFVDVQPDTTVLQAVLNNAVGHLIAECGGNCTCATCHIYVDPRYISRLPKMEKSEDEMLEGVAAPRMINSRLACQVVLSQELSGMVVRLPDTQS
jgi:2Fe-2S ferredoxin